LPSVRTFEKIIIYCRDGRKHALPLSCAILDTKVNKEYWIHSLFPREIYQFQRTSISCRVVLLNFYIKISSSSDTVLQLPNMVAVQLVAMR
jgi:hypothetical protein